MPRFTAFTKPFEDGEIFIQMDKETALQLHSALVVSAFGAQVADGQLAQAIGEFLVGRTVEIGEADDDSAWSELLDS